MYICVYINSIKFGSNQYFTQCNISSIQYSQLNLYVRFKQLSSKYQPIYSINSCLY